jgi:hypothetical protein
LSWYPEALGNIGDDHLKGNMRLDLNNLARQVIHESHLHSTKISWIISIASQLIQTAMRLSYIEKIKIQRQQRLLELTLISSLFVWWIHKLRKLKRTAPRNWKLNRERAENIQGIPFNFNNVRTTIIIQTSEFPVTQACIRVQQQTIIPYQFTPSRQHRSVTAKRIQHSCRCQNICASNRLTLLSVLFYKSIKMFFFRFSPDNFLPSVISNEVNTIKHKSSMSQLTSRKEEKWTKFAC